jgi:hypothetical protein
MSMGWPLFALAILVCCVGGRSILGLAAVAERDSFGVVQAMSFGGYDYVLIDDGATRLLRLSRQGDAELVADAADIAAFAVDADGVWLHLAPSGLGPHAFAWLEGSEVRNFASVPFAMQMRAVGASIEYRDARGRAHRLAKPPTSETATPCAASASTRGTRRSPCP